jgi:Flp pilus assembly protein TadG
MRRLKAIMLTGIVDYSGMMSKDKKVALQAISEAGRILISEVINNDIKNIRL